MAQMLKKCKVCGCEYEYCRTAKLATSPFRWQDVACSPEHGSIYFTKIAESRKQLYPNNIEINFDESRHPTEDVEEDVDLLFEEDFDDNEDDELVLEK